MTIAKNWTTDPQLSTGDLPMSQVNSGILNTLQRVFLSRISLDVFHTKMSGCSFFAARLSQSVLLPVT